MELDEYKIFNSIGFGFMISLIVVVFITFYGMLMGYISDEFDMLASILTVVMFASLTIAVSTYAMSIREKCLD